MYDIIGDIHGKADVLRALLHKLGYVKTEDCYQHAERKAIFLGDFINKEDQTKEVLEIVKQMVDGRAAYAIPGNHELYLLGYFHKNHQGAFIRPHTEENKAQHQPTFQAFQGDEARLQYYLDWLKTLPLYLDLGGCRVVHAFWHQESIAFIQKHYPEKCLSDRLLANLIPGNSREWTAIYELLIGLKLQLPETAGGEPFKTRWWRLPETNLYYELAARPDEAKGNMPVPVNIAISEYTYPENEKPLFFGHYNLPGKPFLTGKNYCCLDFSLADRKIIPAYRWDGEQELDAGKIIY